MTVSIVDRSNAGDHCPPNGKLLGYSGPFVTQNTVFLHNKTSLGLENMLAL